MKIKAAGPFDTRYVIILKNSRSDATKKVACLGIGSPAARSSMMAKRETRLILSRKQNASTRTTC